MNATHGTYTLVRCIRCSFWGSVHRDWTICECGNMAARLEPSYSGVLKLGVIAMRKDAVRVGKIITLNGEATDFEDAEIPWCPRRQWQIDNGYMLPKDYVNGKVYDEKSAYNDVPAVALCDGVRAYRDTAQADSARATRIGKERPASNRNRGRLPVHQ